MNFIFPDFEHFDRRSSSNENEGLQVILLASSYTILVISVYLVSFTCGAEVCIPA